MAELSLAQRVNNVENEILALRQLIRNQASHTAGRHVERHQLLATEQELNAKIAALTQTVNELQTELQHVVTPSEQTQYINASDLAAFRSAYRQAIAATQDLKDTQNAVVSELSTYNTRLNALATDLDVRIKALDAELKNALVDYDSNGEVVEQKFRSILDRFEYVDKQIASAIEDVDAEAVDIEPIEGLTADNVQGALAEIEDQIQSSSESIVGPIVENLLRINEETSSDFTPYKKYTYTNGTLTRIDIYTDNTETTLLWYIEFNYTSGTLTQKVATRTEDGGGAITVTYDYTYNPDGSLAAVTRTIT